MVHCFFLLLVSSVFSASVLAEPATRVFLNGVPAPVYFNDGDSFRVLGGKYAGTKARLSGFNTLESYGPVHQWGGWHAKELYFLAKMATYNAQRGVWNCESDGSTDTYNRILWYCKDLAVDQVKRGLAHAMTVTDEPAKPELVAAQNDAIKNRRGIWAHGVPEFVLTSLHSASEGGGSDGRTYNRMVSSKDGHSEKWLHQDNYAECDKVCHVDKSLPDEALERFVAAIKRRDGVAGGHLEGYSDDEIKKRAARFRQQRVGGIHGHQGGGIGARRSTTEAV